MKYELDTLRGGGFRGLTSAVVALPVSLAFGVASGLGAATGLYGAIAVGFFAAVFGGTRSQISGATAPMVVAMAVIITSHSSNLSEALIVVMMAACGRRFGDTARGRAHAVSPGPWQRTPGQLRRDVSLSSPGAGV